MRLLLFILLTILAAESLNGLGDSDCEPKVLASPGFPSMKESAAPAIPSALDTALRSAFIAKGTLGEEALILL